MLCQGPGQRVRLETTTGIDRHRDHVHAEVTEVQAGIPQRREFVVADEYRITRLQPEEAEGPVESHGGVAKEAHFLGTTSDEPGHRRATARRREIGLGVEGAIEFL